MTYEEFRAENPLVDNADSAAGKVEDGSQTMGAVAVTEAILAVAWELRMLREVIAVR